VSIYSKKKKKKKFIVFYHKIIIHTNTLFLKGYYLNKSKLDFDRARVLISIHPKEMKGR